MERATNYGALTSTRDSNGSYTAAGRAYRAVQIATRGIDYGPVMHLRIEWVDPNLGTDEQKSSDLETLLLRGADRPRTGKMSVVLSHQWELSPAAAKCVLHARHSGGPPHGAPLGPFAAAPERQETDRRRMENTQHRRGQYIQGFPAGPLGNMAGLLADPAINRQASLKVKKQGSKIIYVK